MEAFITSLPQHPFGVKDWTDVQRIVGAKLTRAFPGASRDDVDEALQYAMTDLFDYWVELDSSVTKDTDRNFHFAIRRAEWTSQEFLGIILSDRARERPVVFVEDDRDWEGACDSQGELSPENDRRCTPMPFSERPVDPCTWVTDEDERQRALGLLERLPDGNVRDYLQGYLNGLTQTEEAAAEGVFQTTIGVRRRNAINKLRLQAKQEGLLT